MSRGAVIEGIAREKIVVILRGYTEEELLSIAAAVEAEMREKIPVAMEGGGYIYHSDHSIPPEVSLETYLHAMKVLEEVGRYQ